MIEVKNLVKKYGNHLAVDDLSFTVEEGQIYGFLGPNGAGKSTTMNIMTGYIGATSGEVLVNGHDILKKPELAKKCIGYLPEIPPLYVDMTVSEYLSFAAELKKIKKSEIEEAVDEVLELVQLEDVRDRLIKNLSKGYKQRVGLAQAVLGYPEIIILDEPTVGLDPKQIIEIRNLISRLGKNHTIILSSHILSEIQAVCKRVIIINRGEVVADDTAENLSNKLSTDHSLVARIVCADKDMLEALSTVKGVKNVTSLGRNEENTFDFLIEPEQDKDIRADVFDRVVSRGKTMLSLTSNKLSQQ